MLGRLKDRRDEYENGQNEVPLDGLKQLDIPELYNLLHAELDKRSVVDRIRGNVAFKKALIMGWLDAVVKTHLAERSATHQQMNSLIMRSEASFIHDLQSLGIEPKVESELSPATLNGKAHLFMSTHQGGGLETYVLAELLRKGGVKQFRYVVKDEIVHLPIVGKTISSRNPILVQRAKLKDESEREQEIERIGEEVAGALAGGENVLFFFEGTRSKSGAVAHTENRRGWCRKLMSAIETASAGHPQMDYGKALVVLDTLSVLPVALEKDPFGQTRTNAEFSAKIMDANNLTLEENPENPYDEKTLFGKARTSLKQTLIDRYERLMRKS